ncbi:TPA: hypothetical protein ACSB0Y_001228 [Acinetobacter baumannii]|uniref:hypothetical protein n=1 Tax=Acinetobacter baumannii TaxID=470 RepID=UPI0013D53997|nr:hypothetical protein [Acinetobacter baumannii]MDO7419325.1 hypothetical protein [Acinetobacter baumannii]MDV7433757.1 hypothetical protein [Acinetobacter baumannii]
MSKLQSPLKQYWAAYGGWGALFSSKYLWFSFVFTLMCYSFWSKSPDEFINMALSALPNLLGFALGGYAVWLGIGDQQLKKLLSQYDSDQNENQSSDFMVVNATFVHFILVQIITLIYIVFLKTNSFSELVLYLKEYYLFSECLTKLLSFSSKLAYGLSFFMFIYSILSMLAATWAVFSIARWSDQLNRHPNNK